MSWKSCPWGKAACRCHVIFKRHTTQTCSDAASSSSKVWIQVASCCHMLDSAWTSVSSAVLCSVHTKDSVGFLGGCWPGEELQCTMFGVTTLRAKAHEDGQKGLALASTDFAHCTCSFGGASTKAAACSFKVPGFGLGCGPASAES